MYVAVGEHRPVIPHRGFFQHDPVRRLAGTQRRILLGNSGLRVHGRIADLEQARILRVRILVGVDCWRDAGRGGKKSLLIAASIGRTIDSMNAMSSLVRLYFLYSTSSVQLRSHVC